VRGQKKRVVLVDAPGRYHPRKEAGELGRRLRMIAGKRAEMTMM